MDALQRWMANKCGNPNDSFAQAWHSMRRSTRSLMYRFSGIQDFPKAREKLVVLGTGWGALYLIQSIDPTKYDVTVISPRGFFVYTPLLTSALSGTLSLRSVMEPIQDQMFYGGKKSMDFLEARAEDVDMDAKKVMCRDKNGHEFACSFDKLVLAVGSETNTFGIPGVSEYASFLKEVEDVREIRLQVFGCFDRASVPSTTEAEKKALLNFVIVGGGAAGVEAAAELMDLMREDLRRHYPDLIKHAQVTLIEMQSGLISMFGKEISEFAGKTFKEIGVNSLMRHRVTKIDDKVVHVVNADNEAKEIPYGAVIWASGLGQVEIAKRLMAKIQEQQGSRILKVSPDLTLVGAKGIYAIGDCARITPPLLSEKAESLYEQIPTSDVGAGISWLKENAASLFKQGYAQLHSTQCDWSKYEGKNNLSREDFKALLEAIDKAYIAPYATAQVARQAGTYLGLVLNDKVTDNAPVMPFAPTHYGALSYVGGGRAVVELTRQYNVPKPKLIRIMGGYFAHLMWKTYYWMNQTSQYNRVLSASDYARTALRGRDIVEQSLESTASRQRPSRCGVAAQ